MARIRTVKPGFFTDEELSVLSAETHLFAGGLLCQSDDEGYFKATPGILKGAIFPMRECSLSIHDMLHQLAQICYIRLGAGKDGKRYGQVTNFDEHQRVNRPSPSKISKLQIVWEPIHPQLTESSPTEGKGRERNRERKKTLASDKPTPDPRKAVLRDALKKGWQWKHPNAGECPWGSPEEIAINALLADVGKDMPGESLVQCVRNKFLSDEAHGSKPRSYIRLLLTYMESPLDRFGKPKSLGAANGRQAIGEKENARRASTVEVLRERAVGRRAGNPDGRNGSELSDGFGTFNQKALPDGMDSHREGPDDRGAAAGPDSLPAKPGAEILSEPKRSSRGTIDSSISPAFRSLRPAVVVP